MMDATSDRAPHWFQQVGPGWQVGDLCALCGKESPDPIHDGSQRDAHAPKAAVVRLGDAALEHLRSLPDRVLGPAARRLLNKTQEPCPTCGSTEGNCYSDD